MGSAEVAITVGKIIHTVGVATNILYRALIPNKGNTETKNIASVAEEENAEIVAAKEAATDKRIRTNIIRIASTRKNSNTTMRATITAPRTQEDLTEKKTARIIKIKTKTIIIVATEEKAVEINTEIREEEAANMLRKNRISRLSNPNNSRSNRKK